MSAIRELNRIVRSKLRSEHRRDTVSALYHLEDDWRVIVENSDLLPEKQQQQQTALWELAATEVAYIKTLKVVTDVSKFVDGLPAFSGIILSYFRPINQSPKIN